MMRSPLSISFLGLLLLVLTVAEANGSDDPLNNAKRDAAAQSKANGKPSGSPNKGPPDVHLRVPDLSVRRIELDVDNLRADVSLSAAVAGIVNINAGVHVGVDKVNISIADVGAQLDLVIRLGNLAAIVNRTLHSLELNTKLVGLLDTAGDVAGELVGDVVENAGGLVGNVVGGGGPGKKPSTGKPVQGGSGPVGQGAAGPGGGGTGQQGGGTTPRPEQQQSPAQGQGQGQGQGPSNQAGSSPERILASAMDNQGMRTNLVIDDKGNLIKEVVQPNGQVWQGVVGSYELNMTFTGRQTVLPDGLRVQLYLFPDLNVYANVVVDMWGRVVRAVAANPGA